MKLLSQLARDSIPTQEEPKLIDAIQDTFHLKYLEAPIMSTEAKCPICGGNVGQMCLIDPSVSGKRMWFCVESDCMALIKRSTSNSTQIMPKTKRSIEWPLFCELNDLGDIYHDVSFEKVQQSSSKIECLLKFCRTPKGIILMQGTPGAGKTYAALGVCELFTRTNDYCLFYTGNRLIKDWVLLSKTEKASQFRDRIMGCNLLVIDDLATGEPTDKFMEFFMEIINVRTQWSNRGTIITTNLNDHDFSRICGKALADRIGTGQKFEFKDKSRRTQTIL